MLQDMVAAMQKDLGRSGESSGHAKELLTQFQVQRLKVFQKAFDITPEEFSDRLETNQLQKQLSDVFATPLGAGKPPHPLDFSRVIQMLAHASNNPRETCLLLQAMRQRVNRTENNFQKLQIVNEYLNHGISFPGLLTDGSLLVKGYALSLVHTMLGFKGPRDAILNKMDLVRSHLLTMLKDQKVNVQGSNNIWTSSASLTTTSYDGSASRCGSRRST